MLAVLQYIINLRKQDTYYQTTMGPSTVNNGGDMATFWKELLKHPGSDLNGNILPCRSRSFQLVPMSTWAVNEWATFGYALQVATQK